MYIYFKFLLIIFKHTEKYTKWYKLSDLIITMNNKILCHPMFQGVLNLIKILKAI